MVSIGEDFQQVLDLASVYSRVSSPAMRARDEACRRLQGELREALTALAADAGGSGLDVAVGGRQASYSPLAWVRIYSREHAPTATAGVYVAYLFAADGSRVCLSLQQGSSEVRSGRMRPVSDPRELLARGAAARRAIRELSKGPLGAGMTVTIDLGWRGLSSVGSYSAQRISNYEYANILALAYASDGAPASDVLLADLYRMLALLSVLYGDSPPSENAGVPKSPGRVAEDIAGPETGRVQGLLREAAIRRGVEVHAEDNAQDYFGARGWRVARGGPQKPGYDLDCVGADGRSLHVEVKGTQGLGEEVFLTRNEARHNGQHPERGAGRALYVASGLTFQEIMSFSCAKRPSVAHAGMACALADRPVSDRLAGGNVS
ncbi:MAG: MrcB family domain-containing protein [Streptosporangiaceae bacterium]